MNDYQNKSPNQNDELVSWIIVGIALLVFWPLGLFLLFRKLFGSSYTEKSSYRQNNSAYSYRQTNSTSYRQSNGSTYNYKYNSNAYRQSQNTSQSKNEGTYAYTSDRRTSDSYVSSRRTSDAYKSSVNSSAKANSGNASGNANSSTKKTGKNSLSGQFISVCLLILTVILFFLSAGSLIDGIQSIGSGGALSSLVQGGFFLAGGGASLAFRSLFNRRRKRYSNYFSIIGDKKVMSVKQLSEITGVPEKTIRKDIQVMVDRDYFGDTAYFDVGLDSLVISADAAEAERNRRVEADKKAKREAAPENKYMATLKQLRDLNDSIADPLISSKIDNIEDLSGKIFRLVEEKPEKLPQIRKFMDYYLPSTLKLLKSYATLEHQGIEGENITSAKQDIARILDTMTVGYKQQLDALFKDEAIDISADIDVLKMTMERDGLTGAQSPFASVMKGKKKPAKTEEKPAETQAEPSDVPAVSAATYPATSPSENPFSVDSATSPGATYPPTSPSENPFSSGSGTAAGDT
ncbi:MAG: 5-bromo-4-chloroindolyl phosphate hydrolysis family protein [Oscillospiraceae bacterium]|nr:5-bromo-4-chloroindolyl phosphate hydrolysis family protein [Oscillospiraceae bacterium]